MSLEGKSTAKQIASDIVEVVKKYFSEQDKIRGDRAVYSDSYKVNKLDELRRAFVSSMIDLLNKYLKAVKKFEQSIDKQVEFEKVAYRPAGYTEELIYFEKKKDLKRELDLLPFYEQQKFYERLLELDDKENLAMIETEILLSPHSVDNDVLRLRVEKAQEKRISQNTRQDINDNKIFFQPLKRTAERILTEIKVSNNLPASAFFAWLDLSGAGGLYSASAVADKIRGSMRDAELRGVTARK